ncbi:hypothetical protein A9R00_10145 [Oleispira antarctica]|uniref:Uncharacterized protein n=1 Tax=Oleispira antarctica TaxID=188908 RepID=A0A1Y5HPI5_OLEAN|nr:hypothetical protein A9R00_10145 [Oleispira antarctica]
MLFTHSSSALITIICGLLLFNNCLADKLKVGIIDFPPFYIINEDGASSGVYLDILKKTLHHAKLDFHLDIYPTKRLYRNLGAGETQLFLGIKGPAEYNKKVLYSSTSVSQIQMRVYALGDTPLPLTKEDINNHRIITMRGYSYGGLINYFTDPKNNIEVTSTTKHSSSFLMLKDNRADYVINYKQPSEMALANIQIPNLKYTSFYDAKIHFIVSKKTPNAERVLDKLERAYRELIERGDLKYITNDD